MAGRIRERSKGHWELVFDAGNDADGKRIRRYSSFVGNKKAAAARLTELIAQYNNGTDVAPARITVGEWLTRWLRDSCEPHLAKSTLDGYRTVVNKRLTPAIGALRLQELRPAHIQAAYAQFLASKLSVRTVEYYHAILRHALQDALQLQLIARNPADAVTAPRPTRTEINPLSPEEAAQLVEAARGSAVEKVILFALHTAMRQGEILALTWKDVDLVERRLQVARSSRYYPKEGIVTGPTKTARSRRQIALAVETVEMLKEHKREQNVERLKHADAWTANDLVFPGLLGAPWPARNLYRAYQRITKAAGLPDARFHDLRHTAATLMLRAGVNPKTVSERLGHTTVAFTLNVYAHSLPDMERDAAERLTAALSPRGAKAR